MKLTKDTSRIEAALRHKNIKLPDFQRAIKIQSQHWNNWKNRGIPGKKLIVISKFLNVSIEWIVDGSNPPEWITQNNKNQQFTSNDINKKIPLISWIKAGEWCETIDNFHPGDAEDWLPCPSSHGPHTYALRVKGDSMTAPYPAMRSYPEGVIIFVDPDKAITNGCRVIAKLPNSNEATFKEYREESGKRYLKPLNPQYPIYEINDDTILCGVVIGKYEAE